MVQDLQELDASGVCFEISKLGGFLAHIRAKSYLSDRIRESQIEDPNLVKIMDKVHNRETHDFSLDDSGALRFEHRICVPKASLLKREIMKDIMRHMLFIQVPRKCTMI